MPLVNRYLLCICRFRSGLGFAIVQCKMYNCYSKQNTQDILDCMTYKHLLSLCIQEYTGIYSELDSCWQNRTNILYQCTGNNYLGILLTCIEVNLDQYNRWYKYIDNFDRIYSVGKKYKRIGIGKLDRNMNRIGSSPTNFCNKCLYKDN